MEGLHRQGRDDMVDHVLDGWVALVQKSGIYEHYNVLTGEPYGYVCSFQTWLKEELIDTPFHIF